MSHTHLDDDPPTATEEACYSKHRREDTQVLHPQLVSQLRDWLATKSRLTANQPLFPVSGRVPGGKERKTHKMIERNLIAARDRWLAEAETEAEKRKRIRSDFLCYCNHDGRSPTSTACDTCSFPVWKVPVPAEKGTSFTVPMGAT